MSHFRRKRRIRTVRTRENNYSYLFNIDNISKSLVDELTGTNFTNDLKFRETELAKSYRSRGPNFWKNIVVRIIGSDKPLHADTFKDYPRDCYNAFRRKFELINTRFQEIIAGKFSILWILIFILFYATFLVQILKTDFLPVGN